MGWILRKNKITSIFYFLNKQLNLIIKQFFIKIIILKIKIIYLILLNYVFKYINWLIHINHYEVCQIIFKIYFLVIL